MKERGAWAPQQQLDSTPQQQRGVGGVGEELAVVGESAQRGGPDEPPQQDAGESRYVFDSERIVARKQGREGWPREARRHLEARRWEQSPPIPRSRASRLVIAGEYLEDELEAEMLGQAAYEHYHSTGRRSDGRRFGKQPKPYVAPGVPEGKVNITDPDSRHIRSKDAFVQGYNAQAVVAGAQIVLAAEITNSSVDWSQLEPMVAAAIDELERAGVHGRPEVALADTQYWNEEHID